METSEPLFLHTHTHTRHVRRHVVQLHLDGQRLKIHPSLLQPIAVQPQPIAVQPQPIAVQPQPPNLATVAQVCHPTGSDSTVSLS